MKKISIIIFFFVIFSSLPKISSGQRADLKEFKGVSQSLNAMLDPLAFVTGKVKLDSAFVYENDIMLYFNNFLAEYPLREKEVKDIYTIVNKFIPVKYSGKRLRIISNRSIIEELVPFKVASTVENGSSQPLVKNISKLHHPSKGLVNKHLAIWQSHGYYYEQKLMRWEWQRARIFQTVEDLYTQSYVLPFLVPMLENAGANVLLPRERDYQTTEIISDNDLPESGYSEKQGDFQWESSPLKGFSNPQQYYLTGENPFEMGSAKIVETIKKGKESIAQWNPSFLKASDYAVYVSYHSFPNSSENVTYTVRHAVGTTKFKVNQKIGGGTWIYLGTFYFDNSSTLDQGVSVSNHTGDKNNIVSADGVKFGGGLGNIARAPSERGIESNRKSSSNEPLQTFHIGYEVSPETSGYPRFTEGARYWLQWAGFNDSIYSPNQNQNDYNDDYMSRGKWVNALSGGSVKNPYEKGLGIPVDLAFAFHTDAGTTLNDSIVGTLGIYTRFANGSDLFPNDSPRLTSRYMTDLIQTQIVEDIRYLYEPIWQRRGLWDKSYSESRTPVVPTMLLELLSHQNLADMRYGLDPQFRFDVSRAIYKGMLRYLSTVDGSPYVVQPLPVNSFSITSTGTVAKLEWMATEDPLEPSAVPEKYIVYTRINGTGFDNGTITNTTSFSKEIIPGQIYSFKITALNEGGESFPSEILSVYNSPESNGKILIINAFDKTSAPVSFASKDSMYAGFEDSKDSGVPYLFDGSYIGSQYEFRRVIPWMDDDSPGFGASYANFESKVIAGNSFDYPYVHGKIFADLGYSFVSTSRNGLERIALDKEPFFMVDVIAGKQGQSKTGRGTSGIKFAIFDSTLISYLQSTANSGGNILLSGSNIATDLWDSHEIDTVAQLFASKTLKYRWMTNQASKIAQVKPSPNPFGFDVSLSFHNKPNPIVYSVESPDGIEPASNDSYTIARYADNNISSGVAYNGPYKSVVLGFPVESAKSESDLYNLINQIIEFFKK